MTILPNLQQENEALRVKLADMAAMLAAASKPKAITMKVTAQKPDPKTGEMTGTNGAVSLYGLGRFPVTLYADGWERVLAAADDIRAFIKANGAIIARKA